MNQQDVQLWATNELHKLLEGVINAKSKRKRHYFIIVLIKDGYLGPSAYGNNNELVNEKPRGGETIDFSGKKVISQWLFISDKPPEVPLIGTSLWRIDNKIGRAKCIYILPPDRPCLFPEECEFTFNSKKKTKAPYIYSGN